MFRFRLFFFWSKYFLSNVRKRVLHRSAMIFWLISVQDGVLFVLLLLKATRQAVFLGRKKVFKFDLIENVEGKTLFRYLISLFNQLSKPFCINLKKTQNFCSKQFYIQLVVSPSPSFWNRCKHGVKFNVCTRIRCRLISVTFDFRNFHVP